MLAGAVLKDLYVASLFTCEPDCSNIAHLLEEKKSWMRVVVRVICTRSCIHTYAICLHRYIHTRLYIACVCMNT